MRIAVYGSGGVGGYFGGRLAQAGEEVILIARGAHLQAIRANGLQVESILGDFSVRPALASDDPARVGQVDVILLGVKAWQVEEAAEAMRPMVGPATLILPLQNGVDAPAQLAAVYGSRQVLGGLCQISAYVSTPGKICHAGIQPVVMFAGLEGNASPRLVELQQAFERAGVQVVIPASIQAAMWEKFIFISALSGVGALTRSPVGVFRQVPEACSLFEGALREVYNLARARGIPVAEDIVQRRMAFLDGMQPDVVASMHRDIVNGRPSELGSQSGAVVRMGLESGVPTPVHTLIYHALLPQELLARGEIAV